MRVLSLPPLHPMSRLAGLILRLALGPIFIAHGWPKLQDPQRTAGFFGQLGLPFPEIMVWVIIALEVAGGALLILGLGTRVVALLMAVEMVFTTLIVRLDIGFVAQQGTGAELDIAIGAGALALALIGPGLLALDNIIGVEPKAVVARRA